MNTSELFGEGYFLRAEGSNYHDYRWLGQPTIDMARSLTKLLGVQWGETICDIGCARGYVVRALRELGHAARGFDISSWAIENADPLVKDYVSTNFPEQPYDYFFMKDVAEHIPVAELSLTLVKLLGLVRTGILLIVPLSAESGGPFIRREDNQDCTHRIAWPIQEWLNFLTCLADPNEFIVSASWHWPQLKPSSNSPLKSCGFLLIKRIA